MKLVDLIARSDESELLSLRYDGFVLEQDLLLGEDEEPVTVRIPTHRIRTCLPTEEESKSSRTCAFRYDRLADLAVQNNRYVPASDFVGVMKEARANRAMAYGTKVGEYGVLSLASARRIVSFLVRADDADEVEVLPLRELPRSTTPMANAMKLSDLIPRTGDAELLGLRYDGIALELDLLLDDDWDEVRVRIPTDRIATRLAPRYPQVCFLLHDRLEGLAVSRGRYVPASGFVGVMKETRSDRTLAYGTKVGEYCGVLSLHAGSKLVSCLIRTDEVEVQLLQEPS